MVIEPHHVDSHFERTAGLEAKKVGRLERIQHVILNIEMACTPLICLVVWTVLFEGVDKKDGLAEAVVKFVNFDNLTQHLANVSGSTSIHYSLVLLVVYLVSCTHFFVGGVELGIYDLD